MRQRRCLVAGWIVGNLAPSWTGATIRRRAEATVGAVVRCSEVVVVVVVGRKQRYPDRDFDFVLAGVSLGSRMVAEMRRTASTVVGRARLGIASIGECYPWCQDAGAREEARRDSDRIESSNKLVAEVQQ